jgi:hypothetical protein
VENAEIWWKLFWYHAINYFLIEVINVLDPYLRNSVEKHPRPKLNPAFIPWNWWCFLIIWPRWIDWVVAIMDLFRVVHRNFTKVSSDTVRQLPTVSVYLISISSISVLTRSSVPQLSSDSKDINCYTSSASPSSLTLQSQLTPSPPASGNCSYFSYFLSSSTIKLAWYHV